MTIHGLKYSCLVILTFFIITSVNGQVRSEYRAFWVDTFNTNLNNHTDVLTVVNNAKAAKATAIFVQVRRRGDSWYLNSLEPLVTTILYRDEYGTPLTLPVRTLSGASGNWSETLAVEARRNGTDLDGRLYVVVATLTDVAGNTTTTTKNIVVPHDQGIGHRRSGGSVRERRVSKKVKVQSRYEDLI